MSTELAAVQSIVYQIQNFDIATLPRRDVLGKMAFDEAVAPATRLIDYYRKIPVENMHLLPTNFLTTIQQTAHPSLQTLKNILQFDPENVQHPSNRKAQLLGELESHFAHSFSSLMNIVSYLSIEPTQLSKLQSSAREIVSEIEDLKSRLEADKAEVARVLDNVRSLAAERGVSEQAHHFKIEAQSHEDAATRWQRGFILVGLLFVLLVVCSWIFHDYDFLKPKGPIEMAQLLFSKTLLLAFCGYSLVICIKNFHAQKHNAIVNRQRQNALMTYQQLLDATKNEDRRDIVLTHVASAIFNPQETGYSRSGGSSDPAPLKLIEVVNRFGGHQG